MTIRNIKDIPIELIDIDMEHPSLSSERAVERHIQCVNKLKASLNLVGQILIPIVVCEREGSDRYWLIDGWGRTQVLRETGHETVTAMVYPSMSLEQRLAVRLNLNVKKEERSAGNISINGLSIDDETNPRQ